MKPPMNGASRGPEKTVIEKIVIARPRVLLPNICIALSEKQVLWGKVYLYLRQRRLQRPRQVGRNRRRHQRNDIRGQSEDLSQQLYQSGRRKIQTSQEAEEAFSLEWISLWRPVNKALSIPLSSDNGAQRIGPNANPKTYRERPSRPTSDDTPK